MPVSILCENLFKSISGWSQSFEVITSFSSHVCDSEPPCNRSLRHGAFPHVVSGRTAVFISG